MARLAALWCVLAALELLLNAVVPTTAFHLPELTWPARLGAVSYDLVALGFALALGAGPLALLALLERRHPGPAWLGDLAAAARFMLVSGLLLLYWTSWAMYRLLGQFLDQEAIGFWLAQPIQVLYWADPRAGGAVLVASAIAAWGLSRWLPRLVSRLSGAGRYRLVVGACGAILAAVMGVMVGELTAERQASPLDPVPAYLVARDNQAGPFAHVLAEARRAVWPQAEAMVPTDRIGIVRRPLVSMPEYLAAAGPGRPRRWNVVLIVVESLRADQLRAYGAGRDVMPAVDALAREGRAYANAYAQSSHSSYASVVPASSQYPLRARSSHAYPREIPYPRVLLWDVLKPLGYRTGLFSSQNEHWEGMIHYLRTAALDRFFHPEVFDGPTYVTAGDTGFARWVRRTRHAGSVDDRVTVGEALGWIDAGPGQPFFVALNLQNSHVPYVVPADFPRRFGPRTVDFSIHFGLWPRDKASVVKDLYADSLAYVDAQIGRLLAHLRARGLWDRTVVVVTGDHGQAFYEHGFAAHASALFDEVMRVPLVIRAPDLGPGLDGRPAQHVDVAPSVLDLLGLPPHPAFQGQSLLPAGFDENRSLYLVAQTAMAHQYAIVRGGHKLIYDERTRQYHLYDVRADPGETRNLAATRPDLAGALADRLYAWREAQVEYYADPGRQAREYPPVLED
jgi:arylsulfatase A-like enzyme